MPYFGQEGNTMKTRTNMKAGAVEKYMVIKMDTVYVTNVAH
jgi:hypothetical protein